MAGIGFGGYNPYSAYRPNLAGNTVNGNGRVNGGNGRTITPQDEPTIGADFHTNNKGRGGVQKYVDGLKKQGVTFTAGDTLVDGDGNHYTYDIEKGFVQDGQAPIK